MKLLFFLTFSIFLLLLIPCTSAEVGYNKYIQYIDSGTTSTATGTSNVSTLDDLTDVSVASPNPDSFLMWNDSLSLWVAFNISGGNITDTNAGTICSDGEYLNGDTSCYDINTSIDNRLTDIGDTNCSDDGSCALVLYDGDLPLANLTTPNCANITGATSNLCNLIDTNISDTNISNCSVDQSCATILYTTDEANLNVNSSNYWDTYDSVNATWFEDVGGVLNLILSELTSYLNTWISGKTTDDLAQGSTNLYDNQSWNQTHADTKYSQYQFGDNYFNGSGNFTTSGNMSAGFFNWTSGDNWNTFNGSVLVFNETKLSAIYYNATQSEMITGVLDGGTLVNTQHPEGNYDGVTINFSEESGSPSLELRVNFTNLKSFNRGVMRYKTNVLLGDYPIRQLWNYNTGSWDTLSTFVESETFSIVTQPVFNNINYLSDGVVQLRIYKASNGNTNNHYYIDWAGMVGGYGIPSGQEVDPIWLSEKRNYLNTSEVFNFTEDFNGTGSFETTSSLTIGENATINGLHIDKINATHWKIWG